VPRHGAIRIQIKQIHLPKQFFRRFPAPGLFHSPSLTTNGYVVTIANVPAQLITRLKDVTADGSILEVVIWKVPKPVPPTDHGYKYRAVYMVDGVRIVGFDNERGKGDHCHLDGVEVPYAFTGVDQLIEDFIAAVAARRAP
jgi:hypothetical protein